jgi:hypothetical protein
MQEACEPTTGARGSNGIEELKKALMGFLNAEVFCLLSPKQFGKGTRTKFFFACGHAVGAHAWVGMSNSELADLMFPLVADSSYVDWSDDSSGKKRNEASGQFFSGLAKGRDYAAKGKKYAVQKEIESLGIKGTKIVSDDELERVFRAAFDGAAHLQVNKSGVRTTGFTFFLKPGAEGFHLPASEIIGRSVRVVQLPHSQNKSDLFNEIVRTLGIRSSAVATFLDSRKNFASQAFQRLYRQGSAYQTQVDWKAELMTQVELLQKRHDPLKYEEACLALEKRERSRLWYRQAPRTDGEDAPRVIKDQPWLTGLNFKKRNKMYLLASKDFWDLFLRDHSEMDGIQQWWRDYSVDLKHRNWSVSGVAVSAICSEQEGDS